MFTVIQENNVSSSDLKHLIQLNELITKLFCTFFILGFSYNYSVDSVEFQLCFREIWAMIGKTRIRSTMTHKTNNTIVGLQLVFRWFTSYLTFNNV